MINLDRFSQGRPDPQEAKVAVYCEACGQEIYEGEEVYSINGEIIHAEQECLMQYINPQTITVEEAIRI